MPLVVGLGNPGRTFRDTPHNIGFAVAEVLAQRAGVAWRRGRARSRVAKVQTEPQPLIFLKPHSFMNLSGGPVRAALARYGMSPADLLVICDDVNLPLGRLRLRLSGSAGGHKGLQSLIDALDTEAFTRLRVGVGGGQAGADVTRLVLRRFSAQQRGQVTTVIERAADAVLCYLQEGAEKAMSVYNRDPETD
jgi:PTH1 family peptidyl-tRNA hydrolase